MKKCLTNLAAIMCCMFSIVAFTACSDKGSENFPPPVGGSDSVVGNWCSDVSGKTCAKWNYGQTWQYTEFKADGTGNTSVYYTMSDEAVASEKYEFTYTVKEDGTMTITPADRPAMDVRWSVQDNELRITDDRDVMLEFGPTTAEQTENLNRWSQRENLIKVPQPAKYTFLLYGTVGGYMDSLIETGFWEKAKNLLTDHDNVRVVCLYKYGKDEFTEAHEEITDDGIKYYSEEHTFTGKYADPGDVVWFELTDTTDLEKIREGGLQALGYGSEAQEMRLCNPNTLKLFLEFSTLFCPAREYVLTLYGHGSGFDALKDVSVGDSPSPASTRGVLLDEWNQEQMNMYQLAEGIHAAEMTTLKALFLHNCLMANMEFITEVKDCAEYILASAHILASDGTILTDYVDGLIKTGDVKDATAYMLDAHPIEWENLYKDDDFCMNGDIKLIHTSDFDILLEYTKQVVTRLIELYPTQKEAIDRATSQVYGYSLPEYDTNGKFFEPKSPFYDLQDYVTLLARETGDEVLTRQAENISCVLNDYIDHSRAANWSNQNLVDYTLSVCLLNKDAYQGEYSYGYEQCAFHKETGWGDWLNINEQKMDGNPRTGGGGPINYQ